MPDQSERDRQIIAAVAAQRDQIEATIDFVHGHPELAHEERRCSAHLGELLAAQGFTVEMGVGGMETAFTARLAGARPGARVGLAALYDAVAAVTRDGVRAVHSCGHGPIAGAATGAALALAGLEGGFAGEVLVTMSMRGQHGYTLGMKTAVSIPDEIFERADALARELGKSRSELYREALADYLARRDSLAVTRALDEVADELAAEHDGFAAEAARKTLEHSEW